MSETEKLLREALPCVIYSVNKWADRACAITQKSFRFPSGSKPTKEQIDETFAKWKEMEELAKNITAHLAKREGVVEVPVEPTEKMLEQGASHCGGGMLGSKDEARNVYLSMLRAAQEGK